MYFEWQFKPYSELSTNEFHDIIGLRLQAFVIEQNCCYLDVDGKDKKAYHLLLRDGKGDLIGTTRILHPGVSYAEVAIGRVAIAAAYRGKGLGHELMRQCKQFIQDEFGIVPIRLSAQAHLENFYTSHGFVSTGKRYLEDEIPHVELLLNQ